MRLITAIVLAAAASVAQAQHQPYAGQQQRDVKALSADEVKQYLEGAGMGYAKAAELNHYPGPAHALELAEQLGLSREQRLELQRLKDAHHAEATQTGANVVEAERNLELLFRRGKVGETELAEAVRTAAILQGEYRTSHLETHRRVRAVLTDEQVAGYDRLRGYAVQSDGAHRSRH
jgi:Spy/CpxP family protein refolding chaperone